MAESEKQRRPAHEVVLQKLSEIRYRMGELGDRGLGRPDDEENPHRNLFAPLRFGFEILLQVVEEMETPDQLEVFVRNLERCAPGNDGHLYYRVDGIARKLLQR